MQPGTSKSGVKVTRQPSSKKRGGGSVSNIKFASKQKSHEHLQTSKNEVNIDDHLISLEECFDR